MLHYEVVWDGTRATHPYVFAELETPRAAPPTRTIARQVLDCLQEERLTYTQIVACIDGRANAVNSALDRLKARGFIAVVGHKANQKRGRADQVFGLTAKGRRA